ncbi:MAG: sulfatase [Myxococcota bacterium]|nr:sulfatase [Myxococcota bacterium]
MTSVPPPSSSPALPQHEAGPGAGGPAALGAGLLAGALVGVGELVRALAGSAVGATAVGELPAAALLVVSLDLLLGGLVAALLLALRRAWRSLLAVPPAEVLGRLLAVARRHPSTSLALLGGGLLGLALSLALIWPRLVELPQRVHSPTFAALAALLLVGGALALGLLLWPLLAWPLARLFDRWQPPWWLVLAGTAGLGALGLGVQGWRAREVLVHLPLGWVGWPLVFLLLLVGFERGLRSRRWWPRWWPGLFLLLVFGSLGGAALAGECGAARRVLFRGTLIAASFADSLRDLSDFDRDGAASWFGGADCAPFDRRVHPGAAEIPRNGLDDDCRDGDQQVQAPQQALAAIRHPLPSAIPPARNLLLVTVDALRADHLGLYGYPRPTSPALDALATRAVVFDRFYTPSPCTRWALPMLQLSRWPSAIRWNRRPWPHEVTPQETTFAELLRQGGVLTAAVWVFRSTFGLDQGFVHWRPVTRLETASRAPEVTDAVLALLDELGDGRFFLWVHYFDPHDPYRHHGAADLPSFGERPVDRYDEELALVDREVGRLVKALEDRGLLQTTVFALTADHGEEFGEHGGRAHFGKLYDELVRIPLLVLAPGVEPRRVQTPASLLDLLPTFFDLLGMSGPLPRGLAGRSLVPLLLGQEQPARAVFCSLAFNPTDKERARAVIVGDHKLILDPRNGLQELYNFRDDPRERRNLAAVEPQTVQRLLGLLLPWMAAHSPEGGR